MRLLRRMTPYLMVCLYGAWWGVPSGVYAGPDTLPGTNPSSRPEHFFNAGDRLYFVADDGIHGREPWYYSPREGVRMVADLAPGPASLEPYWFFKFNQDLVFRTNPDREKQPPSEYYNSESGVVGQIVDKATQEPLLTCQFLGMREADFLLGASTASRGWALWNLASRSNQAQSYDVAFNDQVFPFSNRSAILPGGKVYIVADSSLWRVSGPPETPGSVKKFDDLNASHILGVLSGRIVFAGDNGGYGMEPWRLDGATEEVTLLADIAPGPAASSILEPRPCGDWIYFCANDLAHGNELWRTDGTPEGTYLVKDIFPGFSSSTPYNLVDVNSLLYFAADDGIHGVELWRSDGTENGTILIADFNEGTASGEPWSMASFKGECAFCVNTSAYGEQLFFAGGSGAPRMLTMPLYREECAGGPNRLVEFEGLLYFTHENRRYGEELWCTDGTTEGTRLVADLNPIRSNPSSSPHLLGVVGDTALFTMYRTEYGVELWRSGGTAESTALVRDIQPGKNDSAPREGCKGTLGFYFDADDGAHGREVWRYDPASGEAALFADIVPGANGSAPHGLAASGGLVYCLATGSDGVTGAWWMPEQNGQARPMRELFPELASGETRSVVSGGGFVYLCHIAPSGMEQLFRIVPESRAGDACPAPALKKIAAFSEMIGLMPSGPASSTGFANPALCDSPLGLFAVLRKPGLGAELWLSADDATASLVNDLYPGPAGSGPRQLLWHKDRLYFAAELPSPGVVLCESNGTVEGTGMITAVTAETARAPVRCVELGAAGNCLVCSGRSLYWNNVQDMELFYLEPLAGGEWRYLPCDLFKGRDNGSWPRGLMSDGGRLFFSANDGVHGEELWSLDPETLEVGMVADLLEGAPLDSNRGRRDMGENGFRR